MGLYDLATDVNGSPAKQMVGEKTAPGIGDRLFSLYKSMSNSTYGPTGTNLQTMAIISKELEEVNTKLLVFLQEMAVIEKEMVRLGAPWVEGGAIPEK